MGLKIFPFIVLLSLFMTGCSHPSEHISQGYIEGRYTYVATPVAGRLKALWVDRGVYVKQGQKLFALETQPESDIYQAALENLGEAKSASDAIFANLNFAKLTYDRYKVLVVKNAIQQAALDNAKAIYESTRAQFYQSESNIASLKASLAQAKWTLEQKTITSPFDALVFDVYYRIGEYVTRNQALLSLLVPNDIKVIFYVSEKVLGSLHLQDKVIIRCDGCEKKYIGKISFISPTAEYTPPVIYSNETNEKLVFRIEAAFEAEDAYHLHPGQPVGVTYQLNQDVS